MWDSLIWVALALLVSAAFSLGSQRMRVPRDPTRERPQDADASEAYDLVSRWPLFALQRHMVLRRLIGLDVQGTVVDIGCGPGHLTHLVARRFPGVSVIGIDNNEHMLRLATKNRGHSGCPNLRFCLGDAHQLPLGDGEVDFVLSSLSLHHWGKPARALQEIRRVLRPGGWLLLFDLSRDCRRFFYYSLRLGQGLAPRAIRNTDGAVGSFWASYTRAELEALLFSAGFGCWSVEAQPGWMFARGFKE